MSVSRPRRFGMGLGLVLFLSLSCSLPAGSPAPSAPPGDAVATALAQTQAVQMTIAYAAAATLTALPGATTQAAPLPEPSSTPTYTPAWTETPSLTPTLTMTFTPSVPMISVSVDTNCRTGPGKVYDLVGALTVGKSAEVVARDPTGNYWYIRNPNNPTAFCWVWGQYATVSGNIAGLPVYTPPPTPTPVPDFTVSFASTENCILMISLEFTVKNTGSLTWQSYQATATDTDHAVTKTVTSDIFREYSGCTALAGQDDLTPGESGTATVGGFSALTLGPHFNLTIKLCSQDGLGGTCLAKSISFTIPSP